MPLIGIASPAISDNPPGVPLIGYQNIVTAPALTSFSAASGFPVSNLANPATHIFWKSSTSSTDFIRIGSIGASLIDYVGIAGHNFGSIGATISISDTGTSPASFLVGGLVTDDSPIIARFNPGVFSGLEILISFPGAPPQAAVIYCGKLLVLERGIKVDVTHVPITFGRRTRILSGMSEAGNFLGRLVLSESRESRAEFFGFTPDFYRQQMEPFVAVAMEKPFFWAWAPSDYPLETGYSWLVSDVQPEVSPDHRRVAVTLDMAGLA